MTKFKDYMKENLPNGASSPIPLCITIMEPEVIEYIPGQSLTISFPVMETYLNSDKVMQGGFIAAAIDNVFGILIFLERKTSKMSTIDMQVNYHAALVEGDNLTITARIRHNGNTIVNITAEGFRADGKLAVTASTNLILR